MLAGRARVHAGRDSSSSSCKTGGEMQQNKTTMLHLRVTLAEKRELIALAARWQVKPSALLRSLTRALADVTRQEGGRERAT